MAQPVRGFGPRPLGSAAGIVTAAGVLALAAPLASSCGGTAVVDGEAETSTGTSSTTTTGGTTTTTVTTTATTTSALAMRIVGASLGANCMPDIPEDPLYVSLSVQYNNSAGTTDVDVKIVDAKIVSSGPHEPLETEFLLSPEAITVPAGLSTEYEHLKVPDSAIGDSGCAYCGAWDIELSLTVNADGALLMDHLSNLELGCAY